MSLTVAGIVGAIATLIGTVSGFVVALRRSEADGDDHWQELVRAQLSAQIIRNAELEQKISDLWSMLDLERNDRRRVELSMASRISLLESILRSNGIALPN